MMLLTRNQFLIIVAVFIVSCGSWAIILKMFLDSSLALKWSVMVWFFGGCLAGFSVYGIYEYFHLKQLKLKQGKHHQQSVEFTQTMSAFVDASHELSKTYAGFGKRATDIKIDGEINPEFSTTKGKNHEH